MTTPIVPHPHTLEGTQAFSYGDLKAAFRCGTLGQQLATLTDEALIQTAHAHLWALGERGIATTLARIGNLYGTLMAATLPEHTAITREGDGWWLWLENTPIGVARSWRDGAATLHSLVDEISLEQARWFELPEVA
jgi:hypothetical protein